MYNFKSLVLTNYHLWDDLEFEFQPGVTHVYGRNRSGKSLFVSPIPSILYDTDAVPDNSRATLSIDSERHNYDFTVFNQGGKRNKFEIAIDGKSQKTETIAAGRNLIEEHFCGNVQYSLFETTVSVSGLTEHPLARKGAKASQRLDWVHETLAYASILDSYLEDVERKLKATRDDSIKFTLLKDQIQKLEVVEKPTINVAKLKERLTSIVSDIRDSEDARRQINQALSIDVKRVTKPEISLEEAQKQLARAEATVKYQSELKPLFESYEEDLRKYEKLKNTIEAAKNKYLELCEKLGKKAINPKKAVDLLEEEIDKLQAKIRKAISNNSKYEDQTEDRKLAQSDIPLQWNYEKDFTNRIKDLRDRIAINSSQIKFAKGDKRNCPMCGSDKAHTHNPKQLEADNEKAKKRLAQIEEEYAVWQARQKTYVEYIDIDDLEKKIKRLTSLKDAAEKYLDVKRFDVEKPEQVEFSAKRLKLARREVEVFSQAVIEAKAYKQSQKIAVPDDNQYVGMFKADLTTALKEAETRLKELYAEQQTLNDKLIKAQTQKALYLKYVQSKRGLIEDAKPLKQANSDNRLLAIAKKALGRDGFRTKRLESTLELFVQNLNEFAPLIWDEPFKFEIEAGKRKCDVIAHRNKKHGTTTTFSGSERRCWQALAAISMLRLLPNNRRCDTIILDELEANMDMPNRHKLMQDFIPELQRTVPNVLIISPYTRRELGIIPEHSFTVEKRGAKSRLLTS